MRLRLVVMRHAKSSWSSGAGSDHARPLNNRGRRDAPAMGAHLLACGWVPDAALSSDATRTRDTWTGLRAVLPDVPVRFSHALYLSTARAVLQEIGATPPTVGTLLVLGHNPTWEALVAELTDEVVGLPTAAVALLEGEFPSWTDAALSSGMWRLVATKRPKELAT